MSAAARLETANGPPIGGNENGVSSYGLASLLVLFAAEAGGLEIQGAARVYPRMQILSVPEILLGNRLETPTVVGKAQHPQTRTER